ncbi:formate dehydrogenase accessory sulfurtransferase FdhD [Allohahella marinimesophila]|uniref:Sulfur carrier protein FdhD n=1 Tax=Allohahella marinimesophila TaxID=1054972 RepID=A0ABP7NZ72_9GAMM
MTSVPASNDQPAEAIPAKALGGSLVTEVVRIGLDERTAAHRALPEEAAIAFEINGRSYAVMMGSPVDLADFALGFVLSEQLVHTSSDILELNLRETEHGWLVKLWLEEKCAASVIRRIRLRTAEGSCGLCGLQSLAQVHRPLPRVQKAPSVSDTALFSALASLRKHQPLNAATGGTHAAAFYDRDGHIQLLREDVGRHNALDKLIGALASAGQSPAEGFFLLTSRCSYELVEKTVIAGCSLLVTVSTATSLAVDRAQACGLTLIALARSDAMLEVSSARDE